MTARGLVCALALALAGCAAAPPPSAPELAPQTRAIASATVFGPPRPFAPSRSNAQIAQDILALGFRLESGRDLPVLSRFEGPVRLILQGAVPPLGAAEVDRLVTRLRREARLDVQRVTTGPAQIAVDFVPRAQLRRAVPEAACFVVPNIASWDEFRANPRSPTLDWTPLRIRERALVVVPADVTVQEMRDCLHEEIAQALGPLNDLYRIGETVWNDDNFQTTLTGYDMLVLRVWNDPALRPGMSRAQVAQTLPGLLARYNPAGGSGKAVPEAPPTPRDWVRAVETALSAPARMTSDRAARAALAIALEQGWRDERMAFSLFLAARFAPADQGAQALAALQLAAELYDTLPGTQAHRAHLDLHLSAQALGDGDNEAVLRLTDRALPSAKRVENGALVASLLLVRAQALERMGRGSEARSLRRDAVPFAVFGFGSEPAARARASEIAALGRSAAEGER